MCVSLTCQGTGVATAEWGEALSFQRAMVEQSWVCPALSAFLNICLIDLLQFSRLYPPPQHTYLWFFLFIMTALYPTLWFFLWQNYRNIPKPLTFTAAYKSAIFTKIMCVRLNSIHKDHSWAWKRTVVQRWNTFPACTVPWVHRQHRKNNESMP